MNTEDDDDWCEGDRQVSWYIGTQRIDAENVRGLDYHKTRELGLETMVYNYTEGKIITPEQVNYISKFMKTKIELDKYDYYLEPDKD